MSRPTRKGLLQACIILGLLTGPSASLNDGPTYILEPEPRVSFLNSIGAVLACQVAGHPPPSVTWLSAGDTRVTSVLGVREVRNGPHNATLRLLPFRPEQYRHDIHATTYRCIAENSVGSVISRPSAVQAVVPHHFEVGVSDMSGQVGGSVLFTCDVPPTVVRHVTVQKWIVDGRMLTPSLQPEGRFWALLTGELLVRSLRSSDSYSHVSCTASHKFDPTERSSNTARIVITGEGLLSRPQLLVRREWLRPWDGEDVVIPCIARGYPPPTVTWFKDDDQRSKVMIGQDQGVKRRVRIIRGQLIFRPVSKHDSGVYLCVANNSAGADSYRVELSVRVPIEVDINPRVQRVDLNQAASLTCEVKGHPVTSLSWVKDGKQLSHIPRVTAYGKVLRISQVTRDDGGMYQCIARNEEDAAQGTAQLNLGDSVPTIDYRFISQTLQPGPLVSLKCVAMGAPPPLIHWDVDGFSLPQNDRIVVGQYVSVGGGVISHVNISSVRSEDGGSYTCTATNRAGTDVHTARLNVYGPAYVRPMSVVSAVAGEDLYLTCPASGYPLAKITWERDSRILPTTARQTVHENGTLVILKVQKSTDGGNYICSATDKQGRSHSSTATLQVLVPPKLSRFSFRDDLALGDRVSAPCTVNRGDTPLKATWLKDGVSTHPLSGVTVRQLDAFTTMLTIEHLGPEHAGNYTCVVTNDASTVQYTATLHVNVPPVITPFSFGVANAGERIQVVCSIRKGDPPFTITWLKDEQPFSTNKGIKVRPLDQYSSALLLEFVEEKQSGNYTCVATNAARTAKHSSALSVNVPPSWVYEPQDLSVVSGNTAVIPCKSKGFPPPTITWRKAIGSQPGQYTPISSLDRSTMSMSSLAGPGRGAEVAENGTLIVRESSKANEGQYLCEASNGVGAGLSSLVSLNVNAPPEFDRHVKGEVFVQRGSQVALECLVRGDSPLSLEWTKDQMQLPQKMSSTEEVGGGLKGKFHIRSAVSKDAGTYRCFSENQYGSDNQEITLIVQDVPRAPYGLRVDEKQSRKLVISWLVASEIGSNPVDKYIVQYRKYGETTWTTGVQDKILSQMEPTITLQNLDPSTSYTVRVLARNHLGTSLPSEALQVRTTGEPPSAPPIGVNAEPVTSTTIRVSWEPPPTSTHHGTLLGFSIGVKDQRLRDEEDYNFTVTSPTSQKEIIQNLKPWTYYSVVVRAYNNHGPGPLSTSVRVQTLQDVPFLPPTEVDCSGNVSPTSLKIRWKPPPEKSLNGVLQGYKLDLTKLTEDEDFVNETTRITTSTQEVVIGLTAWTNYSITVAALTQAGVGVSSQELLCTTREDVPGAPSLRALQSDKDSILLTWLPPDPPSGVILSYTLHHRGPQDPTTTQYPLSSYTRSYTVNRLAQGTHRFWLTAQTQVGEGKSSSTLKVNLADEAPLGISSWGRRVVAQRGEDVRLECAVAGRPPTPPSWFKDGSKIHEDKNLVVDTDGSLLLRKLAKTEEGNYTCSLDTRNSYDVNYAHGYTSVTYPLLVQVPPSAPYVNIEERSLSSITLKWGPGESGGAPVRSWNIWWRKVSGSGEWRTKEVGRGHLRYTIKDLHCGSEYQVYLTARTQVGVSPPSRPLTVKTKGGIPIAPPTHQVASANATNVRVWLGRWGDGGCVINHFMLQIRPPGDDIWTTLASNLAPQETYDFSRHGPQEIGLRLTAHNVAGETTTTIHVGGPSGARIAENGAQDLTLGLPFLRDPRMLASAAASALAVILTITAFLLCVRKKALAENSQSGEHMSESPRGEKENKLNMINQRGSYATIHKQNPSSGNLDQIPEYSEDIYPYATFQLDDGRLYQENQETTTKFQTFIHQDTKYGITEARPPLSQTSGNRKNEYSKVGVVRSHGRGRGRKGAGGGRSDSDRYDTDSDTEIVISSRTESSNQLDSVAMTTHNDTLRHLPLDPPRGNCGRMKGMDRKLYREEKPTVEHINRDKNVHHNLIYDATESSSSGDISPVARRKLDSKKKMVAGHFDSIHTCQIQESSLTFPQKRDRAPPPDKKKGKYHRKGPFSPVTLVDGPKTENQNSDRDKPRVGETKTKKQPPPPAGIAGNISSHFRNYSQNKSKEDYSIKV